MSGKTIRIFLVDGLADGLRTAEIGNWTGKAIVAPRNDLPALAKRPDARRTGVYFLVGEDPENPLRDVVYIGEGDDVLTRLASHDKDETRDFWSKTVVAVSKDENLTKAHVRYLESRLIQMTLRAGRVRLTNGTAPTAPPLPEPDLADMEYFLGELSVLLPALGFSFLIPAPSFETARDAQDAQARFVMDEVGLKANAVESDAGFIVAKGSQARKAGVASWTAYCGLRDQLVDQGILLDSSDPGFYEFSQDYAFSSPSAAASVVAARNTNGRAHWKHEISGQTYGDWRDAQVEEAVASGGQDARPHVTCDVETSDPPFPR